MTAVSIDASTPVSLVEGRDLKVGMVIAYLRYPGFPGHAKTITELTDYAWHNGLGQRCRVAKSGEEWAILVPDNQRFEIFDRGGDSNAQ